MRFPDPESKKRDLALEPLDDQEKEIGMQTAIRRCAIVALVLVAPFVPAAATDSSFDITSAKTAFVYEGVIYVSAGYPKNHEGFQELLTPLWEKAGENIRVDSFGQPWREVPIPELERVFGTVDKRYLAVFDVEIYPHEARKAFLWRWGCDDSTLVPVLDLGPHKFTKSPWEWGVDAFGVTSFPDKSAIHPLDKSLIPEEFHNPLSSPGGWELWVNGAKRFSYMDRNQDHDVTPENQLLDHESGALRTIVEKSPFDVRC